MNTYNDTILSQSDLGNTTEEGQTCPTIGYQSASVCVPVTVEPFARTGATRTTCCGSPVVVPGNNTCSGIPNKTCIFTISQDICVAVPVAFGAVATVGNAYVDCKGASATDICANCSKPEADM